MATALLSVGVGIAGALLAAVISSAMSPIMGLLGVVGLIVVAAMMYSPVVAINVLVFSIPFERVGRLTDDSDAVAISVSRILGVLTLLSLLLHVAIGRKKLRFSRSLYFYAGYAAIAILGISWAWKPEETTRHVFFILGNLMFFFLIANLVRNLEEARRAILIWLLATILAGGFSLGDYVFGFTGTVDESSMGLQSKRLSSTVDDGAEARSLGVNVRRLFGTTAHPTLFGLNNLMAVPFFVWAIQRGRSILLRLVWLAGLGISVGCVVLSNTRAVLVAAAFVALFTLIRGLWRLTIPTAVALLALGLAIVPFIPRDVYLRVFDPSMYTTKRGDSLRVRFKFWEKSGELITQTFFHGIGTGNLTTLQERITDEATGYLSTDGLRASAHNEYIWVMVEVGIFGYVLFWSFIAVVTAAVVRAAKLFRLAGEWDARQMLVAGQTVMFCVLLLAVQSEVFHYPLKAWWLLAAIGGNLLLEAKQRLDEPQPSAGPAQAA